MKKAKIVFSNVFWVFLSWVVFPVTFVFVILSLLLGFWVSLVGLAYLVQISAPQFLVDCWHSLKLNYDNVVVSFLAEISRGIHQQGPDCLRICGSVITATTLLLTIGAIVLNRIFSKNIETVKTLIWCHDRYFKLKGPFDEVLDHYVTGLKELSEEKITKPALRSLKKKLEEAVAEWTEFYHCEFHFYKRGLISTDIFSLWMRSWTIHREVDAVWIQHELGKIFDEALESLNDPWFTPFCQQMNAATKEETQKLCVAKAILAGTNVDDAARSQAKTNAKHAEYEVLRKIATAAAEWRGKWQDSRYGRFGKIIRRIDFDASDKPPEEITAPVGNAT